MGNVEFKVGGRVIVDAKVLVKLLPPDASAAERRAALSDKYFVTGIGPTSIGIRNEAGMLRRNILRSQATSVAEHV